MEESAPVVSFAPYAALAFMLAGLVWIGVGNLAMKRAKHGDLLNIGLSLAAYLTGAAFLLGFFAWLG